jgi:hypothetical protein
MLPADSLRPTWSSANALVYIGGLVVLIATGSLLAILEELHGEAALVGYSALAGGLALGLAFVLEDRGRPIAAGVAAVIALLFLAFCLGALLAWIGILDQEGDGYEPAVHIVEAALVLGALLGIQRFRAPLFVLVIALTFWITFADLTSYLSWDDAEETVSLAVGAVLAVAGVTVDQQGRRPFGFWLHVSGGGIFGGAVLALVSGDGAWLVVGLLSLVYAALAYWLERSSYAVYAAIGILATTAYFALDGFEVLAGFPFGPMDLGGGLDPWEIAISFVAAGLLIGLLGLAGTRIAALRRRPVT